MTKIAFVSTMSGFAWGGSEELWSQAAAQLAARPGLDVSVCATRPHKPTAQFAALGQAGCHVQDLWTTHRLQAVTLRFILPQVKRWLQRLRPDLVVISQGSAIEALELMQACGQCGLRYAPIIQAASETVWPESEAAAALAQTYRQAAAVYFVSQANRRLVQRQIGVDLPQASVVRNPFKVSYETVLPWPSEEPLWRLACVARLHPASKGQDVLFEVLQQEKWRQRPLHVTLFGNGPQEDILRRWAEQDALDRVTFGGFSSDVAALWAGQHALILPSRFEGLPLAIVEAMLCGRPVIVTDVSGNTELVEDDVTGFVAAAPTPKLLDEAMERAWQRRADWAQMGQAAAHAVRRQVPCDPAAVFAQQLLEVVSR